MILVSKQTEYAAMVLKHMRENKDRAFSVKKISEEVEVPFRFLGHIMAQLATGGYLVAKEGRGGGYRWTAKAESMSMLDLMQVLGESVDLARCAHGEECSRKGNCTLKPVWDKISSSLRKDLAEIKVASL